MRHRTVVSDDPYSLGWHWPVVFDLMSRNDMSNSCITCITDCYSRMEPFAAQFWTEGWRNSFMSNNLRFKSILVMKIQKNVLLTINEELLPKPVCRSTLLIQSMVSFKPIKAVKNTPARIMWKIWYCECISLYRRSLRVSPSRFRYQIRIDFEHIDHPMHAE